MYVNNNIWIFDNIYIQGGFFNWSAQKMTKCQITCKSLQKSSKCQNFLRVWHLVIFRADQLKKPPCILGQQRNIGEHQGSSEIILALRFHRPVQGPAEKFAFWNEVWRMSKRRWGRALIGRLCNPTWQVGMLCAVVLRSVATNLPLKLALCDTGVELRNGWPVV